MTESAPFVIREELHDGTTTSTAIAPLITCIPATGPIHGTAEVARALWKDRVYRCARAEAKGRCDQRVCRHRDG